MAMLLLLAALQVAVPAQPGVSPLTNERLDRRPPVPEVLQPAPEQTASVQAAGSDEPIRTIMFQGTQAPKAVADAASAFIGRPATRETLVELAGALSRAYERTNVALYTVAIPAQDLDDGVVDVDLIEGWVDEIIVRGPPGSRFDLVTARAKPLIGEQPLTRRRFERQSSLMQSIPGLELEAAMENPEGDDSVQLILTPTQKRAEGALGINNRGPNLLGNTVLQAGLDFYRLLTDGDHLSFSGYATPNFRNYLAVDGTYAVPIGASGLGLSATGGWIGTKARDIEAKGNAEFAGLTLSYPILREARRAADISFGVDGVNSDNALFGNIFSTERTRAARLAGSFVAATEAYSLQLSATLSRGLDIFRADVGDTDAEVGFTKLSATAALELQLASRFFGRATAIAQYSKDRLPASELLAFGGAVIGRAFNTGIVTGDRGIGGVAELAYRPIARGPFAKSEIYGFGDAATLRFNERPSVPSQKFNMASAGAGIRANYKERMQFGIEAAAVLNKPFADYDDEFRASFYYSILF
jgi:hemolysin activation/secretion protein